MPARESWRNVGQRIRLLRKEQGLTLKQLAMGCDLSQNAISLVERGEVAPTVATLCKIASALGVPASSFLYEVCPGEVVLVRAQESRPRPEESLLNNIFGDAFAERPVMCVAGAPPPEMVLCLCGQIDFEDCDGQVHSLNSGDRLSCNGNAPQRWRNPGDQTAIAIVVIPPPA
ncbi:MAG: XRE family transcriptional regulator [Chloroflexota bacterium]